MQLKETERESLFWFIIIFFNELMYQICNILTSVNLAFPS